MPKGFSSEVLAINSLRAKFFYMGQRTLARRITDRNFTDEANRVTAANVGTRSYVSTCAAIRRFDAKLAMPASI